MALQSEVNTSLFHDPLASGTPTVSGITHTQRGYQANGSPGGARGKRVPNKRKVSSRGQRLDQVIHDLERLAQHSK